MDELERQLRDLAAHRASQVPEFDATSLPSAADDDGRNWGALLAVAALIVALVLGGGYLLFGRTDDDKVRVVAAPSSSDAPSTTVAPTTPPSSVSSVPPPSVPPPTTVPRCPPSGNDTLPQSGSGNATPPPLAQQQAVTVRTAACVSQVVFSFTLAMPDWTVGYQSAPFEAQPSGQPVSVAGGAFIVVRFDHANAFSIPTSPAVDSPIVREIRKTQDFEGVVTWVIGLDTQRPFGVSVDADGHITIDIEV